MTTLLDQLNSLDSDDARTDWRTFAGQPLHRWLPTVRARRFDILIEAGLPHLAYRGTGSGWPVIRDYWALKRHTFALGVALARTHPEWWSYVSGQQDMPPTIEQIPKVADLTSADGWSFACGWCGGSSSTIDEMAMPWCPDHDPETP